MTTMLPVQCYACTRLDRTLGEEGFSGLPIVRRCEAFAVIPQEIRDGADHRRRVGGEKEGLTFQQLDTEQGHEAFEWWEKVFEYPSGA